jgi:hypothetical protein
MATKTASISKFTAKDLKTADIQVLPRPGLATDPFLPNQVQKRVVHPDSETNLQIMLRSPGIGLLYQVCHG